MTNKTTDTGFLSMLAHDFQECTCEDVTVIVWYGDDRCEVNISARLWAGMLAGGQDELRLMEPTLPVHDNDDHGADGVGANDDHD